MYFKAYEEGVEFHYNGPVRGPTPPPLDPNKKNTGAIIAPTRKTEPTGKQEKVEPVAAPSKAEVKAPKKDSTPAPESAISPPMENDEGSG